MNVNLSQLLVGMFDGKDSTTNPLTVIMQFILSDAKVAIIGEIWKSRAKLLRNRLFEKIASVTG